MGEVWGWVIQTAFVFVVKVLVYVCSHSSWWVTECKLKILSPLIGAWGLKVFLV